MMSQKDVEYQTEKKHEKNWELKSAALNENDEDICHYAMHNVDIDEEFDAIRSVN